MNEVDKGRAEILNRLPMVRWDRCIRSDDEFTAYGWIDRDDFVLVAFIVPEDPLGCWFWTSSATWSEEIHRLLGGAGEHAPCERVNDVFGDRVPNRVGAA